MKKLIGSRSLDLIDKAISLVHEGEINLAREYINLAREYSSKGNIKIPIDYKRKFCRRCNTPLVPGITERRRIRKKVLIRTCLICGWIRRYELRENKTSKSSER
jgi:ribonuclease P protein subunit RPR2